MLQFPCIFESQTLNPTKICEISQTHLCLSLRKSQSFGGNTSVSTNCSKINSSIASSTEKHSSTITVNDDLIYSRGLSSQISCRSPRREDSVVKLLESSGFSQIQITTVISKYPRLLKCHPEKSIKPKIDFFRSIGMSEEDVANMITNNPEILTRSLKDHIIPSFDLLTTLLGGKQNAILAIKRFSFLFRERVLKNAKCYLSSLRKSGVLESHILIMLFKWGIGKQFRYTSNAWFSKAVGAVMKMGFDPCSSAFAEAVCTIAAHNEESNWKKKIEFYRSLGFSNKEVLSMFRKNPKLLRLSEEKIRGLVGFYIEKLHWSPSQLSAKPTVLRYSLENRIIPRCSVLQLLVSRGRIGKVVSVYTLLHWTDKGFEERYVNKYMDEEPEVLDAYQGKLMLNEYNFDSW